jgi:DNA invertase Pin-like site-specific DNA recombinase
MSPSIRRFVAYYRVSTARQGRSGLGLEAQKAAVLAFVNHNAEFVAEFTEVESGKHAEREELRKAIAACKKHKARLVIAKLDRLSRNLAFIATLMESGVEFVAVDMPEANKLTVHIPLPWPSMSGSKFQSVPETLWRPPNGGENV